MTQPEMKVEREDDTLWCLHIAGPDEVHPAPDRATAQLWAAQWTVWNQVRNPTPHPFDPVMSWTVAAWPYDAASHADGLTRSIEGNTFPVDPLAPLRAPADVREALQAADAALRDYACHGGEGAPCLRSSDQCATDCGKRAGDALLIVEKALSQGREGESYGQSDMLGYGYAGYCAGWKAAIGAVMKPGEGDASHGQVWLRDNPPKPMDAPLFRAPLPSAPVEGDRA